MKDIIRMDSVGDYNSYVGAKTLHPHVSVLDYSALPPMRPSRKLYSFYAVVLKDADCGTVLYGRHSYDYQEGTMLFIAPGQVAGAEDGGKAVCVKGHALLFHPDLLRGTPLAQRMRSYGFFSYDSSEALHISERERQTILTCLRELRCELERGVDRHSKDIITASIEVLLNHCLRFYDRQFSTRSHANKDILLQFEKLLHAYFESNAPQHTGLPSVQYFADTLSLSPGYFGELIRRETGKTAQEHIQLCLVDKAKDMLCASDMTVSEIAYALGFHYPHHLSRMFRRNTGLSPSAFRAGR